MSRLTRLLERCSACSPSSRRPSFFLQFRGDLTRTTPLTVLSPCAGLVVDPGAKVMYNGVEIGNVAAVDYMEIGGTDNARLTLRVQPRYLGLIPRNVVADVSATTVFGNKYIAFSSPTNPSPQRITSGDVIEASSVTTEFNTLFETVMELADHVDPVKLNATLTALADATTGLGERFGDSLVNANRIISARTLNDQRDSIDSALMAAIGFSDNAVTFERAGPYLVRAAEDLRPTTKLLDDYRAMIFCTARNYAEVGPRLAKTLGGDNGYALKSYGTVLLPGNPFVYPDNLPRVNARGGPEGRPGCWQKVTKDLWPFPYLVMDTGVSIAPYNHFEIASPWTQDYIWGRTVGEATINP